MGTERHKGNTERHKGTKAQRHKGTEKNFCVSAFSVMSACFIAVLSICSNCLRALFLPSSLPLCLSVCLCAFSATAEDVDIGMGLGIEPQEMVFITIPLNTTTTSSFLRSTIYIIPNQTSHGFLIIQNNTSDDAVVQMAVVPENILDNAPVFTINQVNFLISASSSKSIEYAITSSLLTPIMCCKWNIYAMLSGKDGIHTTIIEINGHMLGAEILPETEGYIQGTHPTPNILCTVFHDTNGDGVLSSDEKGMEGIALCIKDKTGTTTTTGQAMFQCPMSGTQTISVDINTVPIEYVCAIPIEQTVIIPQDGIVFCNFPLQLSSRIEGLVFIDENRNGLPDKGEQGVRDAVIYANDGIAMTSYDGSYRFSGMLSGKYTLKLNEGSIIDAGFSDYEPTTPTTIDVELQQGQRLRAVNFGIAKREKEIEFE
ncbi:hypothetical protein HY792_06775 [Candidatus Desantisbacteria bacterium]|nr:hypothetical protein [Candidatus Desantisbacteria bacterium]